jgi:hypothetical protein
VVVDATAVVVVASITILAMCAGLWGYGIKWTSEQWGGSESNFVAAVILALVVPPVFVVIGIAVEVKRILDKSHAAREA